MPESPPSRPDTVPALRALRGSAQAARADLILVPVADGSVSVAVRPLGRALAGALERRARTAEFRGRPEDLMIHQDDRGSSVALVGLGSDATPDALLRVGARGRREAERLGARRVAAYVGASAACDEAIASLAQGFLLAGYRFDRYRSERREPRVESLTLVGEAMPPPATTKPLLREVASIAAGVFGTRDLVNEPPSVATPSFIAEYARRLAEASPALRAEAWGRERMAKEGLAGCLAVARGSAEEPRFITLRYVPVPDGRPRRRIAIVGKGITFDSGGLSLKPAKSMETMKYDMAGGATALHVVSVASALALPLEVTAYVPATENLPGGRAQKPGDVIRYANGKTVEVLNTDAEGRLVLADALLLAARAKPDTIIDLATLTGGARVALGALYACVLGNDQPLVDQLLAAGRATAEGLWQLPLVREYREDLKSPIADLKNVGGDASTIIGALFLGEFVNGIPWAHLDIAGPAYAEKDLPLAPRGATGYGVRLLVEYLRSIGRPETSSRVGTEGEQWRSVDQAKAVPRPAKPARQT
jgi:leucyl aminopeptidase